MLDKEVLAIKGSRKVFISLRAKISKGPETYTGSLLKTLSRYFKMRKNKIDVLANKITEPLRVVKPVETQE